MTTLLYLLAAAFSLGLTLRAWAGDRADPVRRAFVVLGALFATYFGGFALFLLPGMSMARYLQSGVAAFIPVAMLWFLERLLVHRYEPPSKAVVRMSALAPFVATAFLTVDIAFYRDTPRGSPAEVLLAIWCYGGMLFSIHRLWQVHDRTASRVEKSRLRYLLVLIGLSFTFTLIEDLIRGLGPVPDISGGANQRAAELQGVMPPISTVFTTLFLYFLYQVVQLTRLLDLHEIFSRIVTLGAAALLLVFVDGMAVLWLGGLSENPVHGTFQIFLASLLFLAVYDPMRTRVEALVDASINARGRRLEQELAVLDRELGQTLSLADLGQVLLGRLHGSGRVPSCNLYLRDPDTGLYRLQQRRGPADETQMETLAGEPFALGFQAGERAYVRVDLERTARMEGPRKGARIDPEDAQTRLRTMDAMGSDLTLPFRSGDRILGWLNLKDEAWSDGFSRDEIRRLAATVDRAVLVLENIRAVETMKEQHRLAALGTMAAGLAHEIRNPLAGIKGAAQLLRNEQDPTLVRDFLEVIVGETDRLNRVVSQFLDYARPFEMRLAPTALGALVQSTVDLLRRADLPPELRVDLDLDPALPSVEVDPDLIRQILLNLIHNAAQVQPKGGRIIISTRSARLRQRSGHSVAGVELQVTDEGPGVPPEDMDKLFIPFFTTRSDGNGLGLAICRRLVEAHQGEIQVRSPPGRGATFLVRLPIQQPQRTLAESHPDPSASAGASPASSLRDQPSSGVAPSVTTAAR